MPRKISVKYYVEPDPAALARRAAQYFVEMAGEAVAGRGRARIAISGGSTPKAAFELLADPSQPWRWRMPWENLELYWVDERGVGPDDAESNYRMTCEAMLDQAPLRPEQIHRMEGELNPEEAAMRYESDLRSSLWPWAWDRTATPPRFFRISRHSMSEAGWWWPTTFRRKTPGALRLPGRLSTTRVRSSS